MNMNLKKIIKCYLDKEVARAPKPSAQITLSPSFLAPSIHAQKSPYACELAAYTPPAQPRWLLTYYPCLQCLVTPVAGLSV